MILERFLMGSMYTLGGVLVAFPPVYLLLKRFLKLHFRTPAIVIAFLFSWFFSAIPACLFGQTFYSENNGAILLVPAAASFVMIIPPVRFQLHTLTPADQVREPD